MSSSSGFCWWEDIFQSEVRRSTEPFHFGKPLFRFGADLPNPPDPGKPVPALFSVDDAKKPVSQADVRRILLIQVLVEKQFLLFLLVYILNRLPYMVDKQVVTELKHLVLRTTV